MTETMGDKIKFFLALTLLVAGLAGYYWLSGQATVVRVLVVLAGIGASAAVAWQTDPGRRFFGFAQDSVTETRKVVWPSRKESIQTTVIVFAFVVVMALVLWIADLTLRWALYDLLLGWKK